MTREKLTEDKVFINVPFDGSYEKKFFALVPVSGILLMGYTWTAMKRKRWG